MLNDAQELHSSKSFGNTLIASLLTSEVYRRKISFSCSTHSRTSELVRAPTKIQQIKCCNDLISLSDQITSCYSTFTHPAEETNAIYDILKGCHGRTHKAEVVSTIARGWNVVCRPHLLPHWAYNLPTCCSIQQIPQPLRRRNTSN